MKASIKFREDQKPLVRAKIPISILGLPFLSGVSAGESRELRLDLATAFDSGPSFRVSYRPNDSWNPFSLVIKTGNGAFGSPYGAPIAMAAEFGLLGRGTGPSFSILFKPHLGDFSIKKAIGSEPAPAVGKKIVGDAETDGEVSVRGIETPVIEFRPENRIHIGKNVNGFPTDFTAGGGGIQGLLSGVEVTARSVLPLRSRTAVRFRWGVRVPPELRTAFLEDAGGSVPTAGISLSKLPQLVMNKISIEHVAADEGKPKEIKDVVATGGGAVADVAEACLSMKRQLEALQAENGLLRKAVEELRAEFVGGNVPPVTGGQFSSGAGVGKCGKTAAPAGNRDRRSDGKLLENSGKTAAAEVDEELKKALMGAGKI